MKIRLYGALETMSNRPEESFSNDDKEKKEQPKESLRGAVSNLIAGWTTEKESETTISLKSEFKKYFVQFLTQLIWGVIINLRVIYLKNYPIVNYC